MQRETYDLMLDQVRATYRALTGSDLPEPTEPRVPLPPGIDPSHVVTRNFVELEAWVRLSPLLSERVPPFSFTPPVDVFEWDKELVIELGAPGVEEQDVRVERAGDTLVVSGVRKTPRADGRNYRRAELPRGPFRRVVHLPHELASSQPRVEVAQGLVRVRVGKPPMGTVAQA
jgi:HSP20 family molecular chaperone IbpA